MPPSTTAAAVVGVILNPVMFFAFHVPWSLGYGGRFSVVSATTTVGAALALRRFKVGMMPLLGACAAAGLTDAGLRSLSLD